MKEEMMRTKIKFFLSILLCMMVLGLTGVTFAWFRSLQQLNTVALVQIPSRITLSGPNRSELQRISLELTDDDTQNENEVTIRRVFCIESTADFCLEVIRTTNIEDMDIRIYPVKQSENDLDSETVKGTDGVKTYYYYTPTPNKEYLDASYLNPGEDGKTANNTLHTENYDDGDVVQKNAEPLYWRTTAAQVFNDHDYSCKSETAEDEIDIYYRYYVLELSWDTSESETDMVYLLASHIEQ